MYGMRVDEKAAEQYVPFRVYRVRDTRTKYGYAQHLHQFTKTTYNLYE